MSDGTPIDLKLECLRKVVNDCGSVLVAYSGGAGSALVAAVAQQELGTKTIACIGVSPSLRTRDLDDAMELAAKLGVRCRTIQTQELLDQRYTANDSNRCYYCKSELYRRLRDLAQLEGWAVVADGNFVKCNGVHRLSVTSAKQYAIRSPLLEAGLTKQDVLVAARTLGLPVRDRPAKACLSARVRKGMPITTELLGEIEAAEIDLVNAAAAELVELRILRH